MYKDINIRSEEVEIYLQLRDEYGVFNRHLDTFLAAAIYGCIQNQEKIVEEENASQIRNRVPQSVILNSIINFESVLNTIAFVHYSRSKSNKILEKVFLDTDDAKLSKQNLAIRYARGGLVSLYKLLTKNAESKLDIIENIKDFSNDDSAIQFNADFGSIEDILQRLV